jgi:hypothetical protein
VVSDALYLPRMAGAGCAEEGDDMYRVRSVSPAGSFFLAFLLPCWQACLAAGHARAPLIDSSAPPHSPHHVPCHTSQPPPQNPSERCPDCGNLVFLKPALDDTDTLAASGLSRAPLQALRSPLPSVRRGGPQEPCGGIFPPSPPALSHARGVPTLTFFLPTFVVWKLRHGCTIHAAQLFLSLTPE